MIQADPKRSPSRNRRTGVTDTEMTDYARYARTDPPPSLHDLVDTYVSYAARNSWIGFAGHDGLMLAARIIFLHLSVSSAMNRPNAAAEPKDTVAPMSAMRALIAG